MKNLSDIARFNFGQIRIGTQIKKNKKSRMYANLLFPACLGSLYCHWLSVLCFEFYLLKVIVTKLRLRLKVLLYVRIDSVNTWIYYSFLCFVWGLGFEKSLSHYSAEALHCHLLFLKFHTRDCCANPLYSPTKNSTCEIP